jgi:hypothetical protein
MSTGHGLGAKHTLFAFLIVQGLMLAGCQTVTVDPDQSLPFPPVWLGAENTPGYLLIQCCT